MNEKNDIPPRPTGPKTSIRVKLVGEDGNAFAILARTFTLPKSCELVIR